MSYSATQYPFGAVVEITDDIGGVEYQGSGVLIAPDEVLTASHVVYSTGIGTASDIQVYPGASYGTGPYGSATGSTIHYYTVDDANDVISNADSQYDVAVIHLTSSFSDLGTMGLLPGFAGGQVNVTGYPAAAGGAQDTLSESVYRAAAYSLLVGTAIGPGSSGGPVWLVRNGLPYVVGLVSTASGTTGYFAQLTSTLVAQIQSWVNQDNPSGTLPPTNLGVPDNAITVLANMTYATTSGFDTNVTLQGGDVLTTMGTDTVDAAGGSDTVFATGPSTLVDVQSPGNLLFVGGASPATVNGGAGSALIYGGAGGGVFSGGAEGNNTLVAGAGATTLQGGGNGDLIFGSTSGSGNSLQAGAGQEIIVEGSGGTTVAGGGGTMIAFGGSGQDVYDIPSAPTGTDLIVGFKQESDQIDLGSVAPSQALSGSISGDWGSAFSLSDGTQVVVYNVTHLTLSDFT